MLGATRTSVRLKLSVINALELVSGLLQAQREYTLAEEVRFSFEFNPASSTISFFKDITGDVVVDRRSSPSGL